MAVRTGPGEQFAFGASGGGAGSATAITGLSSKQVVFGGSSGGLAQNPFFLFDTTNAILQIGDSVIPNNVLPTDYQFASVSSGTNTLGRFFQANAGTAPTVVFDRSRGGFVAPTSVLADDVLGRLVWQGYDGAAFGNAAEIRSVFTGMGANSSLVGGKLEFHVTSSATTLTPALVINSSRQVGIGTTAPTAMLHVVTQTNAQNVVDIQTSAGGAVLFADSSGSVGIGTTTPSGVLQVNFGTSVGLFVSTNSQVGIGTTAPVSNLSVVGAQINLARFGGVPSFVVRRGNGTITAPTSILAGSTVGDYFFQGHDGESFFSAGAIHGVARDNWSTASHSLALKFDVTDTASTVRTVRMVLSPAGNLGVGSTAPTARLTVLTSVDGNVFSVFGTTASTKSQSTAIIAFNIQSTASTSKIGFWTTVGTTRPTSYTTATATTVRTLPSTISTVAGLMSAAERDEFNKVAGVLAAWLGKDARNYGLVG